MTLRDNLTRLYSLFTHSLWPLFPDPVTPYLDSSNQGHPLWIAGNSRHEVALLGRLAGKVKPGLAVVDTGGRSLWETAQDGDLNLNSLAVGLDALSASADRGGIAMLPYPVWERLGEEDRFTAGGWAIIAGPAEISDLAAYKQGREIQDNWRLFRLDLQEAGQFFLLHIGLLGLLLQLFLAILTGELSFFLLFWSLPVLVAALTAAAVHIWLRRFDLLPRTIVSWPGSALSMYLTALMLARIHLPWGLLAVSSLIIAAWIGYLSLRLRGLRHTKRMLREAALEPLQSWDETEGVK